MPPLMLSLQVKVPVCTVAAGVQLGLIVPGTPTPACVMGMAVSKTAPVTVHPLTVPVLPATKLFAAMLIVAVLLAPSPVKSAAGTVPGLVAVPAAGV